MEEGEQISTKPIQDKDHHGETLKTMKGAQGLSRMSRSGKQKDDEIKGVQQKGQAKYKREILPSLIRSKHREGRPIPLKMIQSSSSSTQAPITQAHCEISKRRQTIHEYNQLAREASTRWFGTITL
jgi:hypothetical protein